MTSRTAPDIAADQRGGVLVLFALVAAVLFGISALAVDVGFLYATKTELQNTADASALAAVIDLPDETAAHGAAMSFANRNMSPSKHGSVLKNADIVFGQWDDDSRTFTPGTTPAGAVQITTRRARVNRNPADTYFAAILGFDEVDVIADATAVAGKPAVCILALEPTANPGFDVSNGTVRAQGCSVHVNATSSEGLTGAPNGSVLAESICVSGAYGGNPTYSPAPEVSCPQLADPLAYLEPPAIAGCDHNDFKVASGNTTIAPGVYCGGLQVVSYASVALDPGLYIIKDGPLAIGGSSTLTGTGNSFFVTGTDARVKISGSGTVTLTAPTTGAYAGILMFGDRNLPTWTENALKGGPTFHYEGTIYLPTSNLILSGTASASSPSPHTFVIARSFDFNGSGDFAVNANYEASAVPIPSGLGPEHPRLVN